MSEKGMIFYSTWTENIDDLNDHDFAELMKAVFKYGFKGEDTKFDNATLNMAFRFIKQDIDRNQTKWEAKRTARSEAGKKGGAPIGNSNASKTSKNKQNKQNNLDVDVDVDDNVDVDVDVDDNVNVDEKEKKSFTTTTALEAAAEIDFYFLVNCFNESTQGCFGDAVFPLPSDQQNDLSNTIDKYGVEKYKCAVDKAAASDYLRGGGEKHWTMNFAWFIKETNFAKVLAGNYDNRNKNIIGKIGTNFNW